MTPQQKNKVAPTDNTIQPEPQKEDVDTLQVDDETDKSSAEVVLAQKEVEKYKQLYLRALADFKNLELRTQKERSQMRDMVREQFVTELLPVLDHLELAEVFIKDPGLQMVEKAFRERLTSMGLEETPLKDQVYDPHLAEAIEVVEGQPDDKIIEVTQKAYTMNGHIIRPGKVKVGRSKSQ